VDEKLPILKFEQQIVQAMSDHRVVVEAAETDAEKSTEVPAMLLRAKLDQGGMIGVTEPRRIAAMSLALYVAEKQRLRLGRYDHPDLHGDRKHPGYGVVVVDEAHERGVNQDLIMAFLKQLLRRRQNLKAVMVCRHAGFFITLRVLTKTLRRAMKFCVHLTKIT